MTGPGGSNNKTLNTILQIAGILGGLYYLIHIISYISDGISLFGSNKDIVFGLGILILLLSITLGFLTIRAIRSNLKEGVNSFFLKKIFVVPFLAITTLNLLFTAYLFGNKVSPIEENIRAKTRIVIMLPLGDVIKPAYQDGMRQMYGYAEFLNDYNTRYTEDFEFVPVDHSMNYEVAKQIIEREVNNGTKYFICTMSKVNEELSKNFEEIVSKCKYTGDPPILICTVTSYPKITLKSNSIYRFYIRSQEEGKCLADWMTRKKIISATYIVVNDPYGKGAVEEFKKSWNGKFAEGIKVDFGADVDEISVQINRHLKRIPQADRQAIFIAHYGNGIDNIFKALGREKIKGEIFATSTLSIGAWQEPIRDILSTYNWNTCVPAYNSIDKNQDDVIKNFTTHTLKRLVQAINLKNGNLNSSFDENWKKAEVFINLDITWDTNGDAIIPMKAVDKDYFK
jgi:hypothetical protein